MPRIEMEGLETWSVVKFLEENSVSVVPTKWINNNQCLWPPFPNRERVTHAIKSQIINTCWPTHKVSVFRNSTHDDYNIVQAKARKAEETSDLTSSSEDDDMAKKKRCLIRRTFSSDEEDEEPLFYKTPPKLKNNSRKASQNWDLNQNNITNNIDTGTVNENIQTLSSSEIKEREAPVVTIPATPLCGESCSCCPHIAKFLKEILRQQHLTRAILNDIFHKMDDEKPQEIEKNSSIFNEFDLPFKTKNELDEFNGTLKIQEKFSEAVGEIARFGGNNIYDFVKRALSFFLTNEVAVKYSWLGRRSKDSFCSLPIAQLIIAAAEKANKSADKKSAENAISKWLRRAGERKK